MEFKYQPLKFGVHEPLISIDIMISMDAREMMESCHLPVAALQFKPNGDNNKVEVYILLLCIDLYIGLIHDKK